MRKITAVLALFSLAGLSGCVSPYYYGDGYANYAPGYGSGGYADGYGMANPYRGGTNNYYAGYSGSAGYGGYNNYNGYAGYGGYGGYSNNGPSGYYYPPQNSGYYNYGPAYGPAYAPAYGGGASGSVGFSGKGYNGRVYYNGGWPGY